MFENNNNLLQQVATMVKRAFTKNMLRWWLNQNQPRVHKFDGVVYENSKFYYDDPKSKHVRKQIIPLEDQEEFIINKYKDPQYGLNSADKFYNKLRSEYTGIAREKVKDVLMKIPVYQQFMPARHLQSTTKPIITSRPFERFQIDLMDFSKLSHYNSGYKWILSCIDLFTKHAQAVALKNKTAEAVLTGLKQILSENKEKPHIIQSDNGGEFKNVVTDYLKANGIKQIFSSPYHPQSQGAIESFNGHFKRLLKRYFAEFESKRWVDYIDDILKNYNDTIHGTTKFKPSELMHERKDDDEEVKVTQEVQSNIINAAKKSSSYATSFKDDLKEGDYVRIAIETTEDLMKNKLSKRNLNATYSKEIYKIVKVIRPREFTNTSITPIKYRLVDENDHAVPGLFYRLRLLKTVSPRKQIGPKAENTDEELNRDDAVDNENESEKVESKPSEEPKPSEVEQPKKKKKSKPVEPVELRRSTRERRPRRTFSPD